MRERKPSWFLALSVKLLPAQFGHLEQVHRRLALLDGLTTNLQDLHLVANSSIGFLEGCAQVGAENRLDDSFLRPVPHAKGLELAAILALHHHPHFGDDSAIHGWEPFELNRLG